MIEQKLIAADIARTLKLLSAEIGSAAYKRRNPNASDEESLAWGMSNRILFVCEAIDVLTLTAMEEAEKKSGQSRQ